MPTAVASKVCTEEGEWWLHPDSNRTWTNFTICQANTSLHHSVKASQEELAESQGKGLGGWLGEGLTDCVQPYRQH